MHELTASQLPVLIILCPNRGSYSVTSETDRARKCLCAACFILTFLSDRTVKHMSWEYNFLVFHDLTRLTLLFYSWHCLSYRNIQEEQCPTRQLSLRGDDIILCISFPPTYQHHFCHPISCVSFIWSWLAILSTVCLRDSRPCFCVCVPCVRCVLVCICSMLVYIQPRRSLYTSLALMLCQLGAFEQM